jgi:hypothetical protein
MQRLPQLTGGYTKDNHEKSEDQQDDTGDVVSISLIPAQKKKGFSDIAMSEEKYRLIEEEMNKFT